LQPFLSLYNEYSQNFNLKQNMFLVFSLDFNFIAFMSIVFCATLLSFSYLSHFVVDDADDLL